MTPQPSNFSFSLIVFSSSFLFCLFFLALSLLNDTLTSSSNIFDGGDVAKGGNGHRLVEPLAITIAPESGTPHDNSVSRSHFSFLVLPDNRLMFFSNKNRFQYSPGQKTAHPSSSQSGEKSREAFTDSRSPKEWMTANNNQSRDQKPLVGHRSISPVKGSRRGEEGRRKKDRLAADRISQAAGGSGGNFGSGIVPERDKKTVSQREEEKNSEEIQEFVKKKEESAGGIFKMAWRSSGVTHSELISNLFRNGVIKSQDVKDVMMKVDRGKYVSTDPYSDSPQSIGHGATISAPHMHATALERLKDTLKPGNKALDIGSGTGYLTVCMAEMVKVLDGTGGAVVGIDYIPELVDLAVMNVQGDRPDLLKSKNFRLIVGDGWKGGPTEFGYYDAIHVGAAARKIPQALIDQLAIGGKMIIPVGRGGFHGQDLLEVTKDANGKIHEQKLFDVVYVPLVELSDGKG